MNLYNINELHSVLNKYDIYLTDNGLISIAATSIFLLLIVVFLAFKPKKTKEKVAETETTKLDNDSKTTATQKGNTLNKGLEKTRNSFLGRISSLFESKTVLNSSLLEEIHEILFRTDMGFETADFLIEKVESYFKSNKEAEVNWDNVKSILKIEVENILTIDSEAIDFNKQPFVTLVIGVNGVGKTTSCGKLASKFSDDDNSVLLAAADTHRAAAIEQLQVWGERSGVDVVSHKQGADPASVAFDAVKSAVAKKKDLLIIDTAGRLHNKKELMEELAKINKVIKRDLPEAPHETWIVIDATTGQNAFQQVKAFSDVTNVSGIIVTKLDGTAKGGVVIGIANKFKLPIKYIGIGEQINDLQEFSPKDFTEQLFS